MKTGCWTLLLSHLEGSKLQTVKMIFFFFGCLYPWASESVVNLCGGHMRYQERTGKLNDVSSVPGDNLCFNFCVLFCMYCIVKICQVFASGISEMIFEYRGLVKSPSLQCDDKCFS